MRKNITWGGLDAHKKAINVAVLVGHERQPQEWVVENKPAAIRRLVKKLVREANGGEVRCCYEAGPCGYALQRQIEAAGPVICEVIAPALVPRKPGERIKTDRRDARKLAELLRAGLLTEVQAPSPEQEAVRDLCRAREDAKQDLLRCRHRLGKLLLRRGLVYSGGKRAWTQAHRKWLRSLQFDHGTDQAVLKDYLLAIEQVQQRIQTLGQHLTAAAESESLREPVGWLRCFRGIDTVTAVTLVAELHGIERFTSPRQLMAYVGLVPSEHSSSERSRRGGITKAGNSHARRVLIEATWHYRHPPHVSAGLRERRQGHPAAAIAIADKAQQRLYRRQRHLAAHGKTATQAVVAGARELTGFIWAALLHHHQVASVGTMPQQIRSRR
jgi:transposase